MTTVPRIRASVTFLTPERGGRSRPVLDGPLYRPHFVVREAGADGPDVSPSEKADNKYLGVQFTGDGRALQPGLEHHVQVDLIYAPEVDYSALRPGVTFTIREGGSVVGFGRVLE